MTEKAVLSDAGTGPEKEEKITEKNCETCEKAYRKEFRGAFSRYVLWQAVLRSPGSRL